MQTAERDALRATELKTQISELHNAIQQISRQITTRQADPGDEEETQLLDEMKDIQATSVNLQRQATLRLEYLTALVEVTEAGVATKESDLRAVSSGIYAPKQSSPLPVSKDNEFAVSLSANTLSMSPKATSPKPSSPRGTQGSDLSFPSPNILSQISELASSETLASTPPTSPQPTMQSLEFTPSTNVFISAKEFEERLSSLLNSANSKRMGINKPFSDDFIVCIADILVAVGKHTWSERPRTYLVLRLINEVKVMDDFVLEGFKDIDFPYTDSTLPSCIITTGARHEFLQKQRFVLSARSADLVQGGRHHHLGTSIALPTGNGINMS
jgi:hypothetical protein